MENDDWEYNDYGPEEGAVGPVGGGTPGSIRRHRPNTPQTLLSNDVSSQHETAF